MNLKTFVAYLGMFGLEQQTSNKNAMEMNRQIIATI